MDDDDVLETTFFLSQSQEESRTRREPMSRGNENSIKEKPFVLTSQHIDLLRRINQGEQKFVPKGDSENELEDFQMVASNIEELNYYGYLEDVSASREPVTFRRYTEVVVKRLTNKGHQELKG